MEILNLDEDIKVICVTAVSFPNGVQAAYDSLFGKVGQARVTYGLSKPDAPGHIVYKAAAVENFESEGQQLGLEAFTIPKGKYITRTIHNWQTNMQQFAPTFMALLDNPKLDQSSWCVEWYKGDEVLCMVKLQD